MKGGEKLVRKMLLTTLIVCITALLFVLLLPAVYATPPTAVSGFWPVHIPITWVDTRLADGNMFLLEATTVDEWTGDIAGEGSSLQTVAFHSSGFTYAEGILTLDDCTVEGISYTGTLVIRWSGKGTAEGQWTGQWVILSGTGDLEHLHGQGTWGGIYPTYPIAGKIHFDP
jgi:hypothetical protein